MKIAIIDIIGIPYDGTTVFKQGLGGSESAVTLMSKELAALGSQVTVFNNCIDHASPGVYDGVTYRHLDDLAQDHYFDVVISSRTVIPFVDPSQYDRLTDRRAWPYHGMNLYDRILSKAKMRILWMHDTFCLGDTLIEELALADRITDIFTLSDWHTTYVLNCDHGKRRNFEVLKRKIFITRNGAYNYNREVDIKAKDPNLFVYNASVTKGMIPLVNHIWPKVKQQIPNAQLKIIGGFYKFSEKDEPDQQEKDWRNMAFDTANAEKGIEFTGIIPQHEIANVLSKANFMIYPCAFPETYGISTLESLMYNTPSITCRFGGLEEIAIEQACYLIDYAIEPNSLFQHIDTPSQVDKFVKVVVDAYHNRYLHQQKQYYCNIIKDIAGWDSVAKQWRQHIFRKCGAYMPVEQYREVSKINRRLHKIYGRRYHNTVELEDYKSGKEQKIVVVSTMYNAENYIERCIKSVAQQDYENYHHIIIDDASTDRSMGNAVDTVYSLPKEIFSKFSCIRKEENLGAVRNQVEIIRSIVDEDAIIIILDGDDSLINDNTLFSYYNSIYNGSTEFTYGSCWSMVDNIPLISQPYPEAVKKQKAYRQHHFNWILPYTHLRTFKKRLINGLTDDMFQYDNGQWYKAGGDGSVFYALIEQADPNKVKCLQDVVYNYNDISPLNDYKVNAEEQNRAANDIVNKRKVEKYSLVIPTMWRIADQFVEFLHVLCDCEAVGEIIIINNDNTKTPDGLYHHKIKMFDPGRNTFVNPAWNFGVAQSIYDRLCIVNDDVIFDTKLFERLQYLLTPQVGLYGLHPGIEDFSQIPITDKSIDFVEWAPGRHTYGFGSLFFLHKDSWHPIPDTLDIYFGDNFIFDLQIAMGKLNYFIANLDFKTEFAVTTRDLTLTSGALDRERIIYDNTIQPQLRGIAEKKLSKPIPQFTLEPKPWDKASVESKPQDQNKKRILIGIPTAKYIEADTFKAVYDLEVPDGYTVEFQTFYGYNVDQVRNLIAHWTVQSFDYLFSVDSDIAFEKDTLKKLLAHDKDIVSGLYIQRRPNQHVLEIYEDNGTGGVRNMPYEKLKNRGLVQIMGCGFGCVLVKKEVMHKVGYPQCEYHSAIDHAHTISEDNDFCAKARNNGFTIWADSSILCRHIGSFTYTVDTTIEEFGAKKAPVAIAAPKPVVVVPEKKQIINIPLLEQEYKTACDTNKFTINGTIFYSDINEHLPKLRELAEECNTVTEFGVREGLSTRAFLVANCKLTAYDLYLDNKVVQLFDIARQHGKDCSYSAANTLSLRIEPTDMLFIDTDHNYKQLKAELAIHHDKVKKYIVFHDTYTCGLAHAEDPNERGILTAIIEFMTAHPEWKFKYHVINNNGLTVIERSSVVENIVQATQFSNAPVDNNIKNTLLEIRNKPLFPIKHKEYLNLLKNKGVNPKVIYDIGAGVLHWTDAAKPVWSDAEIIAFDAVDVHELVYKESGIKYFIGVLSNETGKQVDFYQNNEASAGSSYYRENPDISPAANDLFNNTHIRKLITTKLDDIVRLNNYPPPDLIKMDVQGAEMDVIKGAQETLKTAKHIILESQKVEYNKGAPLIGEVVAYMDSIGYNCVGLFCDNGPDGDYHFVRR